MKPRIAIPVPTSTDAEYNQRSWPQYAEAVLKAGGEPVEVPLGQAPPATAKLIAGCQGVLLPGSGADVNPQKYGQVAGPHTAPADPARENVDDLLLQDAHNLRKPLFTICFGTQMLNVWRGGSLEQHLEGGAVNHRQRGVVEAHEAAVASSSLLAEVVVTADSAAASRQGRTENGQLVLPVNSSHHQAIATAGDGLRVSALSPEDGVIEAVENAPGAPGGFVLGVQWHPERTCDSSTVSRALFARFIAEAAAWSPKPVVAELLSNQGFTMNESLSPASMASLLGPYLGPAKIPVELYEKLLAYLELILKWNARVNLTAIREPEEIVRRHFGESLFAGLHLGLCDSLLDLGSGAGFPGIPIQLLHANMPITLAESRSRKAAFLREVVRVLELKTEVWADRAEAMPANRRFHTVALRAVDVMHEAVAEAERRASRRIMILGTREADYAVLRSEFRPADPISLPNSREGVLWIADRV